jgi:2-haloacid dehalogenase
VSPGKEQAMPPAALVFDVYGTLLDPATVTAACAAVTSDPAALASLWRQKQLEYTWLRGLMGQYEDFWAVTGAALDYALERLALTIDERHKARLMDAWLSLRPYPEVDAALTRLAPRPLAVLSNGSPAMLEAGLRAAGLRERFRHLLSADAVRTYKPAPAVYALAEQHLALPREQLLFVSANAWDVAGAKAFGLPCAWIRRTETPPERLGFAPDLIVRDLDELATHVG